MDETVNSNASEFLAFDTRWLKENLHRYLWRENEVSGAVEQLEILYVGASSKQVTFLYRIELLDSVHETWRQMYVGYVVPAQRLTVQYEEFVAKAKVQPSQGRAVVLVPEATLILVAFPNDQKLHLLTDAALQSWVALHLNEIANGALDGMAWQVQEAKMEVLRYIPDRRCTTRCWIKIKAETGSAREISFIAKQLADAKKVKRQYDDLVAMRQAWSSNGAALAVNAGGKLPVRLPQALAWDKDNAVVFIEEIAGKNLEQALTEIDLARVMSAVGGMLADFHCAHQRVKKRVSRAGEMAVVHDVVQTITATFPALQTGLRRLLDQLEAVQWDDAPTTLLHGTFRLNHIFIHGEELALIDFDSLRMGPPAYDLANFLSSLCYLEAQKRLSPVQRQQIAVHFLEGYAAKAPVPVSPEVLLWFLATLLIKKQAHKFIKHFHEDRAQKVERMLTLAGAALDGCRNTPIESNLAALWKILP